MVVVGFRKAIALIDRSAEGGWCGAGVLAKQGGEVALARTAHFQGDVGDRHFSTFQQVQGSPQAAAGHVLVRRHARRQFEAPTELEFIDPDCRREVLPGEA